MVKLHRAEILITFLLLAGILFAGIGWIWTLHVISAFAVTDDALSAISIVDLVRHNREMSAAAILQLFGLSLFFITYLVLLLTANRYKNTPFILKGLLWIPATFSCFLGIQEIFIYHGSFGLIKILFAGLLILPNSILTRSRSILFSYILFMSGLLALYPALTAYNTIHCNMSIYSMLLATSLALTLLSAINLSPWLAYLKKHKFDTSPRALTTFRWACIILLALTYTFFGNTRLKEVHRLYVQHKQIKQLNDRINQLELKMEEDSEYEIRSQ